MCLAVLCVADLRGQEQSRLIEPGAQLVRVPGEYTFTEGPTADQQGNVLFSDVHANRIYRWTTDGQVSLFRDNSGNANGLAMDAKGDLLVCESGRGRVVSISPEGELTSVAEQYDGRAFNQPNDLWIDPAAVFIFPTRSMVVRIAGSRASACTMSPIAGKRFAVLDDLVRPNGIVGTPDRKTLFVTDHGGGKTYRYAIEPDGTLARKSLFVKVGADGMKLDSQGNLYLAERGIRIYDSQAAPLETIDLPHPPTNLCFAGPDRKTLFITARTAVYTLRMRVPG